MIVALFNDDDEQIGASMSLQDLRLAHGKRPSLKPGEIYWLRIYLEDGEDAYAWRPHKRDDVNVLDLSTRPAEHGAEPSMPEGAERLLLRVRFEAFNDGPLRKIVRWGFHAVNADGDEDPTTYRTWRIPFDVRPQSQRVIFTVVWAFLGLLLAGLNDFFVSVFANVEADANHVNWFLTLLGTSCAIALLAWVLLAVANWRGYFMPKS